MGINRWTEQQQRADKRGRDPDNLPDAPEEEEGGPSRMEASKEPAEDPEKQAVVEKLKEQQQEG